MKNIKVMIGKLIMVPVLFISILVASQGFVAQAEADLYPGLVVRANLELLKVTSRYSTLSNCTFFTNYRKGLSLTDRLYMNIDGTPNVATLGAEPLFSIYFNVDGSGTDIWNALSVNQQAELIRAFRMVGTPYGSISSASAANYSSCSKGFRLPNFTDSGMLDSQTAAKFIKFGSIKGPKNSSGASLMPQGSVGDFIPENNELSKNQYGAIHAVSLMNDAKLYDFTKLNSTTAPVGTVLTWLQLTPKSAQVLYIAGWKNKNIFYVIELPNSAKGIGKVTEIDRRKLLSSRGVLASTIIYLWNDPDFIPATS
jgi:hypothetical protein